MTFIPIESKPKSYKHSLIIYWTALVVFILVDVLIILFVLLTRG